MHEIWKSLNGVVYCGDNYEVSNLGRVRSIDRYENSSGVVKGRKRKGRVLKSRLDDKGYHRVQLYMGGNSKIYKIHKLVSILFMSNPNNLPCLNHIDGNKDNNSVENLEWTTYSENNKHAYDIGLKSKKLSDEDREWIKKVYKPYDKEFGSRALAKKFNVGQATISAIGLEGR